MRLQACCFAAATLLLLVGQTRAQCSKVDNPNVDPNDALQEYVCEGGSVADLERVPDNVEMLRISNMPVGRVSESLFARFGRSLLILTCSHCSISDIDDRAFRRLGNLQQLSLDNNRLTEVRASWFEGLSDLTYLDLNYNAVERIESEVFRNAPNLVDLRVSGNRLECLDLESLGRLRGLKRIFVNENPNFGCPNAVKRFLAERRLDSEADPEWNSVPYDRVQASAFGSSEPAVPPAPSPSPSFSFYPTSDSSTPSAYTRPRWTEEPPTSPPTEPPTLPPPTSPPRRPYVQETVQPSVPDSSFSVPPYYPPQVTQQQIDNYKSTLAAQQNPTTMAETTTTTMTPEILIAGRAGPVTTTTECPNAASPSLWRNSALLMLTTTMMMVLVGRRLAL